MGVTGNKEERAVLPKGLRAVTWRQKRELIILMSSGKERQQS